MFFSNDAAPTVSGQVNAKLHSRLEQPRCPLVRSRGAGDSSPAPPRVRGLSRACRGDGPVRVEGVEELACE